MALYLTADRGRFNEWEITIGDAAGGNAVIAANDIVYAKIGRTGDELLFEVGSDADTANGSSITAENPTTLGIAEDDIDFPSGIYDIEVCIMDTSEQRMKKAERGVFVLRDSMGTEAY